MKAWSRAQANQEREANLYHHHQAEAELIHSYLHSQQHQQAVQAAVAAAATSQQHQQDPHGHQVPYGVPIPPPLVPSPDPQVLLRLYYPQYFSNPQISTNGVQNFQV